MRHLYTWSFFCLSLLLLPVPSQCETNDTDSAYWLYFEMPPLFVLDGDSLEGFGRELQDLLISSMPDMTHIRSSATPERIMTDLKCGLNVVATAVLHSPERERFLVYSRIPCLLTMPCVLVTRAEDRSRFTDVDMASLASVIADKELVMGHLEGVTYGSLAPLIDDHLSAENVVTLHQTSSLVDAMNLIGAGRIDFMIYNPVTFKTLADKAGLSDQLITIPLEENRHDVLVGYMACPDTPWGREMILRVDTILAEAILSGRYYDLFTRWFPEDSLHDFDSLYRDLIISPAQQL